MKIGIDIGGTFTDIVLINNEGRIELLKVPTTRDAARGVIEGLKRAREQAGFGLKEITRLIHGTTIATNAILEGRWAKTALITTEGFRDVLEIERQNRPKLYQLCIDRPEPLVPRNLRFEVPERLDYRGEILKELDAERVSALTRNWAESLKDVESLAVSFLHSYANPVHEQQVKEILREMVEAPITLSSEVLPEFREYERTSTTAMSAALRPVVERYLQDLERETQRMGVKASWQVMQSNGGITLGKLAPIKAVTLLFSGPAAGVRGARFIGREAGFKSLITLDMGGTSCDLSLVVNGESRVTVEGIIAGRPVRVPMADIHTIGAGGGSIAWIDSGGALRVGPKSAGSHPGPACYGIGEEPTVTDAQLVLGRLNPQRPLGSKSLDPTRAEQIIRDRIARHLGMSLEQAASGILEVADANMERAIRVITIQRGYDPRQFALLAFGGAGPMHAAHLAERLGIPRVIAPQTAGVLSALGLLVADIVHDFVQSVLKPTEGLDLAQVNRLYEHLKAEGRERLRSEGISGKPVYRASIDMRYQGQSYDLNLSMPHLRLTKDDLDGLEEAFHKEHRRVYGHAAPGQPTEVVNLRLEIIGKIPKPILATRAEDGSAPRTEDLLRKVYFLETGWVECCIYERDLLVQDQEFRGPAIVEGEESTMVVPPDWQARVDEYRNLILES